MREPRCERRVRAPAVEAEEDPSRARDLVPRVAEFARDVLRRVRLRCDDDPVERFASQRSYAGGDVDADLASSSYSSAPAIADIDDDGEMEIVATSWNGFITVYEHDGSIKEGFPLRLPEVPSCPRDFTEPAGLCSGDPDMSDPDNPIAIIDRGAFGAPVLEDMDKDGDLDIIQTAFDGGIYV